MKRLFHLLIACAAFAGATGCGLKLDDNVLPEKGGSACKKLLSQLGAACKAEPAQIEESTKGCTPADEAPAKCYLGCLPANTCPSEDQFQACIQKCESPDKPRAEGHGEEGYGEEGYGEEGYGEEGYGEEGYGDEGYGDDFAGE
jgi:hypothetical protein